MRMHTQLCAGALSLALLGSASVAFGQTPPAGGSGQEKFNLNQSQERMVSQGLQNEQSQPASPSFQGEVGSKVPDSMNARQLPNEVTSQVPQTRTYLFVKLPDRILLIDPQTRTVAEVVPNRAGTTGSGSPQSQPSGAPQSPPR
jgi:hypothetical protein